MQGRRLEDRLATQIIVVAGSGAGSEAGIEEVLSRASDDLQSFRFVADRTDFVASKDAGTPDALGTVFVLRTSPDDVLLVSGDEQVVLSLGDEDQGAAPRLAAAAERLRRARSRAIRRRASRDAFVLLSERLSRARSTGDLVEAVLEHLPSVVDGFAAALALRSVDAPESDAAWYSSTAPTGDDATRVPTGLLARLSVSGVLTRESCAEDEGLRLVAALLAEAGATKAAFAGLGGHGSLLLLERRPDREFEADDWHLLGVVARQAQEALARIDRSP